MKITIRIDTNNAAFQENPDRECKALGEKVANVAAASFKRNSKWDAPFRDFNGNTIGNVKANPKKGPKQ